MTVESASETGRKRRELRKLNSSAAWGKKLNLMLPAEIDKLYSEMVARTQNRK